MSVLVPSAIPRKRFTRQEAECMLETGLFAGQHLELIDGDLIDKMGQSPPHRDDSVPEPDLALLAAQRPDERRHPRANELLLAVESSGTTAAFDLTRKASLYAAAMVPEYWVDLNRRMLVVHRQTDGTQYRRIEMRSEEETVSMEGRGETVRVGDLLPRQGAQ